MNLHELYPFPEERAKVKRIGRGTASGQGGTVRQGATKARTHAPVAVFRLGLKAARCVFTAVSPSVDSKTLSA